MALLKNGKYSITFKSTVEHLEQVESITSKIAHEVGFNESSSDDLSIVITELFNNAIHHGNKNDPNKSVNIDYRLKAGHLIISVQDQGNGFMPDSIKNPLDPENLLAENGRGIYLVKMLMDDTQFDVSDQGCKITIKKKIR
ncbi:MAG: ATP-binding protein [Calditrichaceae bacterium]|nr:ATP-binding protein [Calditrichaceae bacterium]